MSTDPSCGLDRCNDLGNLVADCRAIWGKMLRAQEEKDRRFLREIRFLEAHAEAFRVLHERVEQLTTGADWEEAVNPERDSPSISPAVAEGLATVVDGVAELLDAVVGYHEATGMERTAVLDKLRGYIKRWQEQQRKSDPHGVLVAEIYVSVLDGDRDKARRLLGQVPWLCGGLGPFAARYLGSSLRGSPGGKAFQPAGQPSASVPPPAMAGARTEDARQKVARGKGDLCDARVLAKLKELADTHLTGAECLVVSALCGCGGKMPVKELYLKAIEAGLCGESSIDEERWGKNVLYRLRKKLEGHQAFKELHVTVVTFNKNALLIYPDKCGGGERPQRAKGKAKRGKTKRSPKRG